MVIIGVTSDCICISGMVWYKNYSMCIGLHKVVLVYCGVMLKYVLSLYDFCWKFYKQK